MLAHLLTAAAWIAVVVAAALRLTRRDRLPDLERLTRTTRERLSARLIPEVRHARRS